MERQARDEILQSKMPRESMSPLEVPHTADQTRIINRLVRHHKNSVRRDEFKRLVEEEQVQKVERIASEAFDTLCELKMKTQRSSPHQRQVRNTMVTRPNFRNLGRLNEAAQLFEMNSLPYYGSF